MRTRGAWAAATAALVLAGGVGLVRWDIAQRREAFQVEARTAHRLLSQRATAHEAVLGTLVLLAPAAEVEGGPEQRLPALYPQLLRVLRRDGAAAWGDAALDAAEARSRQSRHAELAAVDATAGRFTVVRAGSPSSFALVVDAQRMVPWDEWPVQRGGPVAVRLAQAAGTLVLQPEPEAALQPAGLTAGFTFAKTLAAPGQPFDLQLRRATGPAQWPWAALALWTLAVLAASTLLAAARRARRERERAEARLRQAQMTRLGALGEMAAGIAHELNQPLAALSANTQAARRLLDDDPPALDEARGALAAATAQARRAAEVVSRLRRRVEQPGVAETLQPVELAAAARQALELLRPEFRSRGVSLRFEGQAAPALADPVALQQILHNLATNALAALQAVPAGQREIVVETAADDTHATIALCDSGPGVAPEALPRLFEPFFTTTEGGLGLGLPLCETLATQMGGQLAAAAGRGGRFTLRLARAPAAR